MTCTCNWTSCPLTFLLGNWPSRWSRYTGMLSTKDSLLSRRWRLAVLLLVESKAVCFTSDFPQALCLWFSLHYVLNLQYCTKIKEVALFFQEFVFKLPATSGMKRQKTATYLTATTGIQNFIPWRVEMYIVTYWNTYQTTNILLHLIPYMQYFAVYFSWIRAVYSLEGIVDLI